MSNNKQAVESYIDGFRNSDHKKILSCLRDDVTWKIHGYRTFEGKEAFAAEINNENFSGSPALNIEQLIEEGDRVVATGSGHVSDHSGETKRFVFCEVFSFRGGLIHQIDTYHVWLQ